MLNNTKQSFRDLPGKGQILVGGWGCVHTVSFPRDRRRRGLPAPVNIRPRIEGQIDRQFRPVKWRHSGHASLIGVGTTTSLCSSAVSCHVTPQGRAFRLPALAGGCSNTTSVAGGCCGDCCGDGHSCWFWAFHPPSGVASDRSSGRRVPPPPPLAAASRRARSLPSLPPETTAPAGLLIPQAISQRSIKLHNPK